MMNARSIFICCSSADHLFCKQYSAGLRRRGFATRYEPIEQQNSNALPKEMGWDLRACRIFILLLSQLSASAYRTQLLADAYVELMKQDPLRILFVVRLNPCMIPSLLQSFPCIDAFDKSLASLTDETVTLLDRTRSETMLGSSSLLSRRVVSGGIIGLVGLTALISGTVWWLSMHSSSSLHSSPHFPRGYTIFTYRGHIATIQSVAWSPDGKNSLWKY